MAFEKVHTDYAADTVELPPAADLIAMIDDEGETYESLGETFGCHPSTVALRVQRSGIRHTPAGAPASTAPRAMPLLAGGGFPEWMDDGLCHQTDPEAFFPEKGGSTREAKSICARCPVEAECLDYALSNDERFGIWGGLSERERRKVKKALQAEAGIERFPCPRCDEEFDTSAAVAVHERSHDRAPAEDLPCPHCTHVGKGRVGLSVHLNRMHLDQRTPS